jgi:hypothetical protein
MGDVTCLGIHIAVGRSELLCLVGVIEVCWSCEDDGLFNDLGMLAIG